jgi:hypothetical protein
MVHGQRIRKFKLIAMNFKHSTYRKRKSGRISGSADYILPIALVVGGGFLLYQLFKTGGILNLTSGGGANNTGTTAANSAAATATAQQLAAQGVVATITPNQAASVANQIYTVGLAASDSSACVTINNLLTGSINNGADLNAIISAFGTKNIPSGNVTSWYNTCISLGINCTAVGLGAFISAIYGAYDTSGQYLSNLDSYLTEQGINYQF